MTYWTRADQAELDVLLYAWVEGFWRHRERCYVCWAGSMCRWAWAAFQEVLDWRWRRTLLSRAEALRANTSSGGTPR